MAQDGIGVRLDKFLAAEARLGSRARATTAIQRGKVFLNDREAAPDDAGTRLAAGDRVRVWVDRPGTSRAGFRPRKAGELEIVYEDAALLVVNKPAGLLVVPLAETRRHADGLRPGAASPASAREAAAHDRASHRPRHVRARRVCQGCRRAGAAEGTVPAAGAGARLSGDRATAIPRPRRAPGRIGWSGTRSR